KFSLRAVSLQQNQANYQKAKRKCVYYNVVMFENECHFFTCSLYYFVSFYLLKKYCNKRLASTDNYFLCQMKSQKRYVRFIDSQTICVLLQIISSHQKCHRRSYHHYLNI